MKAKTYKGEVCEEHSELEGTRYSVNHRCLGCDRKFSAERRAAIKQATPKWAKREEISAIYSRVRKGQCVDHIVPIKGFWKGKHVVCGLHVAVNLRVVTKRTNLRKGNSFNPSRHKHQ